MAREAIRSSRRARSSRRGSGRAPRAFSMHPRDPAIHSTCVPRSFCDQRRRRRDSRVRARRPGSRRLALRAGGQRHDGRAGRRHACISSGSRRCLERTEALPRDELAERVRRQRRGIAPLLGHQRSRAARRRRSLEAVDGGGARARSSSGRRGRARRGPHVRAPPRRRRAVLGRRRGDLRRSRFERSRRGARPRRGDAAHLWVCVFVRGALAGTTSSAPGIRPQQITWRAALRAHE